MLRVSDTQNLTNGTEQQLADSHSFGAFSSLFYVNTSAMNTQGRIWIECVSDLHDGVHKLLLYIGFLCTSLESSLGLWWQSAGFIAISGGVSDPGRPIPCLRSAARRWAAQGATRILRNTERKSRSALFHLKSNFSTPMDYDLHAAFRLSEMLQSS
eukprot:4571949-Amphidinium_carterae.2